MVLHFLCFYGHPTLSDWFVSEYKKSGKKLDMGKGCVRFKKLDDLALDVSREGGGGEGGGRRPYCCARAREGTRIQLQGSKGQAEKVIGGMQKEKSFLNSSFILLPFPGIEECRMELRGKPRHGRDQPGRERGRGRK